MCLHHGGSVAHVPRPVTERFKDLVGDGLSRFLERQQPFRLAVLLVWRAVGGYPLRDEPPFFIQDGQSSLALLRVALPARAFVGAEPLIGLGWHLPCDPLVAFGIKQDASVGAIHPATCGFGWWVDTRALFGRRQERFGELRPHLAQGGAF